MLRSVLVVLGSFVAMAAVVMITTPIAAKVLLAPATPGVPPTLTPAYLVTNLVCGAAAALLGGWLAARFAATGPFGHGLALAALVLIMGLVSMRQSAAMGQPRWYALVLALAMPALVALGAWLRR